MNIQDPTNPDTSRFFIRVFFFGDRKPVVRIYDAVDAAQAIEKVNEAFRISIHTVARFQVLEG